MILVNNLESDQTQTQMKYKSMLKNLLVYKKQLKKTVIEENRFKKEPKYVKNE